MMFEHVKNRVNVVATHRQYLYNSRTSVFFQSPDPRPRVFVLHNYFYRDIISGNKENNFEKF